MKKKEDLKAIRELDASQCEEELSKLDRETLNLQFRKATNGIPKTSELKRIRQRIARIQTVIKETALTQAK